MIVVSYGGGTDSTALLIEACNRNIRPDLIVFADTGSEMPHTYEYLSVFGEWLAKVGFPGIQVVRRYRKDEIESMGALLGIAHKITPILLQSIAIPETSFKPLHIECLETNQLPSAAFGYSKCSSKYKQGPIDRWVEAHPSVKETVAQGGIVERWIGYDAAEGGRVANIRHKPPPFKWRAPLYEWDIARAECRELIKAAGLPQPGKSSCFMCPNMRGREVDQLAKDYPELMEIALKIEHDAVRLTIEAPGMQKQGLGRGTKGMRWSEWLKRPKQMSIFADEDDESMPCGCHD
jgi:hypothetical protein